MTKMIKAKSDYVGEHVHVTFFAGEENYTLANIGKLIMSLSDWQLFGAALLLGATHMDGHLKVITDGSELGNPDLV